MTPSSREAAARSPAASAAPPATQPSPRPTAGSASRLNPWPIGGSALRAARARGATRAGARQDRLRRLERDGPLDHVLELAHVPRPRVALEQLHGLRRDRARTALPISLREALAEVLGEERDVLAPLAQRRGPDRDDVQAVVEVLAERASAAPGPRAARSSRRSRARRPRSPPCRRRGRTRRSWSARSSFTCIGRRGLADLVEEERAAVRRLEQALLALPRVGEGALHVAEQLALEQRLGERPAVDRTKGRPSAVERPWIARATSSLPVPLSPVIEDGRAGGRDGADHLEERRHRRRDADDPVERRGAGRPPP